MVLIVGTLLVAPTGPGSDRILYILLLGYSCLLIVIGTRPVRVLAAVLAVTFLVGALYATKEKSDFKHRVAEKVERVQKEAQ